MILAIYDPSDDPALPDKLMETYHFSFPASNTGGATLAVQSGAGAVTSFSQDMRQSVKASTIALLRRLISSCDLLCALPENRIITMRVLYKDDVTPSEFQPTSFRDATGELPICFLDQQPIRMPLGSVETPHHTIKIRVKAHPSLMQTEQEGQEETEAPRVSAADQTAAVSMTVDSPRGLHDRAEKAKISAGGDRNREGSENEFSDGPGPTYAHMHNVDFDTDSALAESRAESPDLMSRFSSTLKLARPGAAAASSMPELEFASMQPVTEGNGQTVAVLRKRALYACSQKQWMPKTLAASLGVDEAELRDVLAALADEGLLEKTKGGRFVEAAPASAPAVANGFHRQDPVDADATLDDDMGSVAASTTVRPAVQYQTAASRFKSQSVSRSRDQSQSRSHSVDSTRTNTSQVAVIMQKSDNVSARRAMPFATVPPASATEPAFARSLLSASATEPAFARSLLSTSAMTQPSAFYKRSADAIQKSDAAQVEINTAADPFEFGTQRSRAHLGSAPALARRSDARKGDQESVAASAASMGDGPSRKRKQSVVEQPIAVETSSSRRRVSKL